MRQRGRPYLAPARCLPTEFADPPGHVVFPVLWLAVFLPTFTLDCCQRGAPSYEGPLGITEQDRLVAFNALAAAAGVQPGQTIPTVFALLPSIHLIERSRARESEALQGLAAWAQQFTPTLSLRLPVDAADPAGLLLDVAGSLRLFNGPDRLTRRVLSGLAENGFPAHTGSACTPTGAWLLARHRNALHADTPNRLRALLARLPVRLLACAQPHEAALQAIGVRTIEHLMQLPRAGLARRFGLELLDELDRATGQRPDPQSVFMTPDSFESHLDLPGPVEDSERLLFGARRLLLQLCGWLAGRQAGARRISLSAEHERYPATLIRFGPDRPSRDPSQLGLLLAEALRRTKLAAATSSLKLQCHDVHHYAPASTELFPGAATAHEQIDRLVERLKARLGNEQVSQLHQVAEHRPEYAWRAEPVQRLPAYTPEPARPRADYATRPPRPAPQSPIALRAALHSAAGSLPAPLRPLWLIEPPLTLSERNNRPFWESPLSLLAGPERIESGWWDDKLVLRDYFIAEDTSHRLVWIFRERLSASGAWYLHGRFG